MDRGESGSIRIDRQGRKIKKMDCSTKMHLPAFQVQLQLRLGLVELQGEEKDSSVPGAQIFWPYYQTFAT